MLHIATLNVWGLHRWLVRDGEARMRAIGDRLADLELDAVAFQEVWTREWREILLDAGRRAGLVSAWFNDPPLGGSGLLVMSRWPLRDAALVPYSVSGRPERPDHGDYYGGKGFARLRVEHPDGDVWLFDTHLVARYTRRSDDPYRAQRAAQLVELAAGLVGVDAPAVVLGDFNVEPEDAFYGLWTGLAGVRDAALEVGATGPTVAPSNPYRGGGERGVPEARIDYVFLRDHAGVAWRVDALVPEFDAPLRFGDRPGAYSDHLGLRAELSRVRDATAAPPPPDPEAVARAERWLALGRAEARRLRVQRRALAGGAFALALGSTGLRLSRRVSRRAFLRLSATGSAAAGLVGAGAFAGLSEWSLPEEIDGFTRAETALASLRAVEARGPRRPPDVAGEPAAFRPTADVDDPRGPDG